MENDFITDLFARLDQLDRMDEEESPGYEEESPGFMEELKRGAWQIICDNPGIERQEWIEELINQYPSEVVDAFGNDPFEVYPLLEDMWDCDDYEDPETHSCMSFSDWSEYLAWDPEALRDQLDKAKEKIRELEKEIADMKALSDKEAKR